MINTDFTEEIHKFVINGINPIEVEEADADNLVYISDFDVFMKLLKEQPHSPLFYYYLYNDDTEDDEVLDLYSIEDVKNYKISYSETMTINSLYENAVNRSKSYGYLPDSFFSELSDWYEKECLNIATDINTKISQRIAEKQEPNINCDDYRGICFISYFVNYAVYFSIDKEDDIKIEKEDEISINKYIASKMRKFEMDIHDHSSYERIIKIGEEIKKSLQPKMIELIKEYDWDCSKTKKKEQIRKIMLTLNPEKRRTIASIKTTDIKDYLYSIGITDIE